MATQGKAAVVTGAGTGIGKAVALALLREGYRVTVFDFEQQREDILAAAKALGPVLIGFSLIFQFYVDRFGALIRYLRDTYGISFVFAHRQGETENARGNCPGPDIWYNVGEWAVRELAMDDGGKGYKEGNGSPIPDSWRRPRS